MPVTLNTYTYIISFLGCWHLNEIEFEVLYFKLQSVASIIIMTAILFKPSEVVRAKCNSSAPSFSTSCYVAEIYFCLLLQFT